MTNRAISRIGAVLAVLGVIIFLGSGMFHPAKADPGDSPAAFAEYAAHDAWILVHLGQFVGIALVLGALVALYYLMSATEPSGGVMALARLGMVTTMVSLAVAALLQAVDGVTLKKMVDLWAAAPAEEKAAAFLVAEGVRWTEIGINSYFRMLFGTTVILFSLAMALSAGFPRWFGWLGVPLGLAWIVAGVGVGYSGFSMPTTFPGTPAGVASAIWMAMAMLSGPPFLLWIIGLGVLMWRRASRTEVVAPSPAPALAST